MKFLFSILVFTTVLSTGYGQTDNTKAGSPIPNFRIVKTNGSYYSNYDIRKNTPFVLIYFAPDCDHCIVMMDQLFKKIHQLDKATIAMVTFKSPNEVAWFEKKYQTNKFMNIAVGTEGTSYVLRNHYRLDKTPFVAVYDKKGKLAFSYKNDPPVNEILARFKKLQ